MVGILVYVIDIQLDANFYMISKFVDKEHPVPVPGKKLSLLLFLRSRNEV